MMTNGWHVGKFGDVLEPISRPVQVEPDKVYRNLGVQWYAKGLFVREEKSGHVASCEIPISPLDEQRRIVAYLDGLYPGGHLRQAKVAALRELQSQTQEELDVLLPSVLDKAFKGEL